MGLKDFMPRMIKEQFLHIFPNSNIENHFKRVLENVSFYELFSPLINPLLTLTGTVFFQSLYRTLIGNETFSIYLLYYILLDWDANIMSYLSDYVFSWELALEMMNIFMVPDFEMFKQILLKLRGFEIITEETCQYIIYSDISIKFKRSKCCRLIRSERDLLFLYYSAWVTSENPSLDLIMQTHIESIIKSPNLSLKIDYMRKELTNRHIDVDGPSPFLAALQILKEIRARSDKLWIRNLFEVAAKLTDNSISIIPATVEVDTLLEPVPQVPSTVPRIPLDEQNNVMPTTVPEDLLYEPAIPVNVPQVPSTVEEIT